MNFYRFEAYKALLKEKLKTFQGHRGVLVKLAVAAGCQRSYLSQVLNGHIHLTPDHALGVSEFFGFDEEQTEYFLTLVDYERAGSRKLKQRLKQRLEGIRKRNANLENRISANIVQTNESGYIYYSSWIWAAVHIAVSIPELQTVEAIAKHLQVPRDLVEQTLAGLLEMGLIKKTAAGWAYGGGEQHLSRKSALIALHHSNWRARAVLAAQTHLEQNYHYTGISSVSRYDLQLIREMLLETTEKIRKIIVLSKEEELICLNMDCFKF